MGHRTPAPQPAPLLGPAQPRGRPLHCSRPTVLPFLQRHSVPVPYRRHLGLYSCYQGNRGTQSPQLPWSCDPVHGRFPPPFPVDKNRWRDCGLGAPHPPAPSGLCVFMSGPRTMLASPSSPPPSKRDCRPWRKFSIRPTRRGASSARVGRGRGPRGPYPLWGRKWVWCRLPTSTPGGLQGKGSTAGCGGLGRVLARHAAGAGCLAGWLRQRKGPCAGQVSLHLGGAGEEASGKGRAQVTTGPSAADPQSTAQSPVAQMGQS